MVKKQKSLVNKIVQLMTHSKDPSPNNLKHYDVILAGGMPSWIMTRNIINATHGHKTVYYDPPVGRIQKIPLRLPYEIRLIEEARYNPMASEIVNFAVAMNNSVKIQKVLPEESAVLMSNGNKLTYGSLIWNTALYNTPEAIPGLMEGLTNGANKVFSTLPKMNNPLFFSFVPLYEHGQAVIYLPEFPFESEIEHMNLLYALSMWDMNEELGINSPLRNLTIVNANNRFASQCEVLDKYIRERIAKHKKVDVLLNTKLTNINNKTNTLTLQGQDGQTKEMEFRRLYCHVPTQADPVLVNSGLVDPVFKKVKVNIQTLAHEKFENVFVYGENIDAPVQPSFEATLTQASVARHNALEYIEGRSAKAHYDGRTFVPLFIGPYHAALYSADWNKGPKVNLGLLDGWFNFLWTIKSYIKKADKAFTSKLAAPMTRKAPKFPKGDQVRQMAPSEHH